MSSAIMSFAILCLALCARLTQTKSISAKNPLPGTYHDLQIAKSQKQTQMQAQNASVVGRPFEAEDIKIGEFFNLYSGLPVESCASLSVQYTGLIPKGDGTFRVPHSRILMDGKKCGTLADNATEDDLWVDNHMELIPVEYLANESISRRKDTNAVYVKLTARRFPLSFYNFSLSEFYQDPTGSNTWIGFERWSDRVCGNQSSGEVRLPQNTIIFFGKQDDIRVNLTNLITRLIGVYLLEKYDPYHISFVQPSDGSDEHVCPQIYRDPLRREDFGDVRLCFPAGATVQLHTGATVRMRDLRIGDRVLDESGAYSPVYLFSHRSPTARTDFISLYTENGHILTLSPGHYVRTPAGLATAAALRVGEQVVTASGAAQLTRIEKRWDLGLYNPHTMSGSIVVNNVVASVYTSAVEPNVAHALLVPFRAMFWVSGAWRQRNLGELFGNGINDFVAKIVPQGKDVVLAAAAVSVLTR